MVKNELEIGAVDGHPESRQNIIAQDAVNSRAGSFADRIQKLPNDGPQTSHGHTVKTEGLDICPACVQTATCPGDGSLVVEWYPEMFDKIRRKHGSPRGGVEDELKWALAIHSDRSEDQGFGWRDRKLQNGGSAGTFRLLLCRFEAQTVFLILDAQPEISYECKSD
jgi:hypothetical protein